VTLDESTNHAHAAALERGEDPSKRRFRGPCAVEGCDRPRASRFGLCQMHRLRVDRGQPVGPAGSLKDADYRFAVGHEVYPSGCWVWIKARERRGYGLFRHDGKTWLAHRWAYERLVGPIPEGLTLDHLCQNTSCVNPAHLEPVTRSENTRRARAGATHCRRGHEFSPDNTYVYPDGRRECRTCCRMRQAARYAARKAS
jgi:hypothetical protein